MMVRLAPIPRASVKSSSAALTPKGRALYDRLLAQAGTGSDNQQHQQHLSAVFRDFPDDEQTLREQELAWFRYRLTPQGEHQPPRAGEMRWRCISRRNSAVWRAAACRNRA
ncbi:hypothetical protein E05_16780 [Plautia stali symbiont]|nr:hypothetical protein E05_16780 [Plautia stali symbiont]